MYIKPLQSRQCHFCGWIGTKERPVRYGICSVCKGLRKKFPKVVECFICGKLEEMTFKEWSERGNCCKECDSWIGEKVKKFGYPRLSENRKTLTLQ